MHARVHTAAEEWLKYKEEKHICLIKIYQFNYIDLNRWVFSEQGPSMLFLDRKGQEIGGNDHGEGVPFSKTLDVPSTYLPFAHYSQRTRNL